MPLEELQKSIEQEAKATASKMQTEADSESERIVAASKEAAAALKKKSKEDALAEVAQKEKDTLTALEIETSNILSTAKEESISRYLKEFDAVIKKKLQAKQKDIIKSALRSFSDVVPLQQATVKIDRKNVDLVKEAVANIEYANIDGIVISSADKRINADATVDGLMESNADAARRILSKGMFG